MSALDGPRLLPVIAEIARLMGDRFALIGGCAMRFYGSPRVTYDVDVAARAPLPGKRPVGSLSIGGKRYRIAGVEVDVVVRADDYGPLYRAALRDSKKRVVAGGRAVRVVSPEFLALMKFANRGRGKDDDDLDFLLGEGKLDRAELLRLTRRYLGFYAVDDVEALFLEKDLMGGRDRIRPRRRIRRRSTR